MVQKPKFGARSPDLKTQNPEPVAGLRGLRELRKLRIKYYPENGPGALNSGARSRLRAPSSGLRAPSLTLIPVLRLPVFFPEPPREPGAGSPEPTEPKNQEPGARSPRRIFNDQNIWSPEPMVQKPKSGIPEPSSVGSMSSVSSGENISLKLAPEP